MKKVKAFTLLEVLLSLFISSFIIAGMITIYNNLTNFVDKSSRLLIFDRKICLLFDQLEKDLSTMFIPSLEKIVNTKTDNKEQEEAFKVEKELEEKNKNVSFFSTKINEDETFRINRRVWKLFKSINFITTNPLEIYDQNKNKLVRVGYFLEKDEKLSVEDKVVYNLFRRETSNLYNKKFEEPESKFLKQKYPININLVAEKIKYFFLEYVTLKENKNKNLKTIEEKKSFTWDDKSNLTFNRIDIKIVFWDENLISERSFKVSIPLFVKAVKKQEQKTIEKKEENKTQLVKTKVPETNIKK